MYTPLEGTQYLAIKLKLAQFPGIPGDSGGGAGGDPAQPPTETPDPNQGGGTIELPKNLPQNGDLSGVVNNVITWGLGIVASVTILMLIVGGILYATAAGDEARIQKAKSTIKGAIIGLIFVLIAAVIVITINNALTGGSAGTSK